MTAAFTIRLDDETLAKLDALAADTDRSRNWLAAKAIENYIELNAWQIARIKEGIAQADRGEFATEEELDAIEAELQARIDSTR
ncbi:MULTISPECIES: ribbon-helix-helix protein, CopG family [unclassified Bosea (in: a-proteobacteria)]|uniref:CopG family ribbon-helix-helix protein n=1 Tax=unclassified Bosea (in: a-proteobacteria) TaxID=2653178 RepID=UPI000F764110|nr:MULTISPECIES: ribbon-helix-helix protein, CopG family [unclassified Bosea (in: a-proteobacteria)]AZO79911.1 CopG family transcriptional regulator [Bosea sp. Tri-49]RXT26917.1 CopG family transcriptional regulator [Bosea sp. Tri-39]RXT39517.1 CopG family transcriptional regulator [Bosea sp. Tri-54]